MSTLPPDSVTIFKLNYNANDISDIDIQQFKTELMELGYARVRGYHIPAAGMGYELWISIQFIGLAAISGLIGHLAVQFFNKVATKIYSFVEKQPVRPFIPNIKISYDDVDIDIRYLDDNIIKNLSKIMRDIMEEISNGRLKECKPNKIIMPMENRDGKWKAYFWGESTEIYNYPFQFWKVTSNSDECFGIYDFINKKFIESDILNIELE